MTSADEGRPRPPGPGRPWVRAVGGLVAVVALAFVVHRAWLLRAELAASPASGRVLLVALGGAVAYGLGSSVLSLAWQRLLWWHGGRRLPWRRVHGVYARTAIAKYLPGNVLHLAARHALSRDDGLSHVALVRAAFHEAASLVAIGGALALVGLLLAGGEAVPVAPWIVAAAAALALAGVVLAARHARPLRATEGSATSATLAAASLLHAGFFVVSGGLLFALVLGAASAPLSLSRSGVVLLSFAVSWLVGFVTPGAPAGLGVREATLLALIGGAVPDAAAVLAVAAFRVVTLGGDVVFFLTSFAVSGEVAVD